MKMKLLKFYILFLFKNLFIILLVLVYVFFVGEYFISFLWNKTNINQKYFNNLYIIFNDYRFDIIK